MDDPFESAMNATLAPRAFYGQVTVDTWYCVLQKGVGKVLFDDTQHALDQRRTAIDITITALPELQRDRPVRREMIAESNEWVRIVLPSIKALGVSRVDLNDKYAQYEMVETGRTWEKNGETKHETMPVFKAVYATLEEAEAAAAELYGHSGNGHTEPQAAPAPAGDAQRATAQAFLPALWMQAGHDTTKMAELIAANPLTSRFFTLDSPEVQAVTGANDEKLPF